MRTSRGATRTSFTPTRTGASELTRRVADAMRARAERVSTQSLSPPLPVASDVSERAKLLEFFSSHSASEQRRLAVFFRALMLGDLDEYAIYEHEAGP